MTSSTTSDSEEGFQQFAAFVLKVEGPPGQEAGDSGGYTTWYGIIQKDVNEFDGPGVTPRRVQDISQSDALVILHALYWEKSVHGLPSPADIWAKGNHALAIVVADTVLNPITGVWPPIKSLFSLSFLTTPDQQAEQIIDIRSKEYAAKAQPQFQKGLQNRLVQLRQFIASLGSQSTQESQGVPSPAQVGQAASPVSDAPTASITGVPAVVSGGIAQVEQWASQQIAAIGQAAGRAGREIAIYAGFIAIIGICVYVIVAEDV